MGSTRVVVVRSPRYLSISCRRYFIAFSLFTFFREVFYFSISEAYSFFASVFLLRVRKRFVYIIDFYWLTSIVRFLVLRHFLFAWCYGLVNLLGECYMLDSFLLLESSFVYAIVDLSSERDQLR